MNLEKATTEAFASYNAFHEQLNQTLKVSLGSIHDMRTKVSGKQGPQVMGEIIDNLCLPWGKKKNYPKPDETLNSVNKNLCKNGISQAFSGFELYMTHLIAILAQFSILRNDTFKHAHTTSIYNEKNPPSFANCCFSYAEQYAKNNVLANRLIKLQQDLNISDPIINELLPLFDFFRLLRNCIVHLDGIANKDLKEFSETETLQKSFSYWNKNFGKERSPSLPKIERGKAIEITPPQTIFSSAVNYKIAQILDRKAVHILGNTGMSWMACYYALLIDEHIYRDSLVSRSPENIVNFYLASRYLIQETNGEETIQELLNCGVWKSAIARHIYLYPKNKEKVKQKKK